MPAGVLATGRKIQHTRVTQVRVSSVVGSSLSILSSKSSQGEIPMVLIPSARSSFSMFMRVPSGVYCIVQKFGKDIGEVEPGLQILPPWYRIAYIVSKQSCTYDAPVIACPTCDDVRVNVDVVVIFAVNDPSKFIYRLGAKNFDDFLSGTVDEAIRMLVRKEDHTSVYGLRGDRADLMLKILNDKFLEAGVRFTDVKITSVWLPDELAHCLETTTKLGKAMERLTRQNEFEMLNIKLESEMAIEEIRRKTEQVLVGEAGRKRQAELTFEQRSVKAEEDGRVALIEAEGGVEAQMVETDGQLKRTKTQLETFRVTEVSKAQLTNTTTRIEADQEQERAEIEATYQEQEMIYEAGCLKYEAETERRAHLLLVKKRKHTLDLREKEILAEMSEKGNFKLVGSAGDQLITSMMSGNFML